MKSEHLFIIRLGDGRHFEYEGTLDGAKRKASKLATPPVAIQLLAEQRLACVGALLPLISRNLRPVFITSRQLALHRQQNGNQQCDCIINLCSTRYLHSEAGTEAYSASKGETSIIHDGLTAEDLRFIPVLFPKSALGTVSSPLYAGRRTSGNGACYSTRF